MEFIYITNDPEIAQYADDCGVDRIMIDLEYLGKRERQKGFDTMISGHTIEDVSKVRSILKRSRLQVRINPIHVGTEEEINAVIERGADVVMLPMFKRRREVENFISIVDGRAVVSLLLETPQALVRIDDILQARGIDEIHIGLNDLHLAMGLNFMFELLSGGIVDYLAKKIKSRSIRFGFGGIARLGMGMLDSRLILSEHVRLGSEIVILSREFHGRSKSLESLRRVIDLKGEIEKLRSYVSYLSTLSEAELLENHRKIVEIVSKLMNYFSFNPNFPTNDTSTRGNWASY